MASSWTTLQEVRERYCSLKANRKLLKERIGAASAPHSPSELSPTESIVSDLHDKFEAAAPDAARPTENAYTFLAHELRIETRDRDACVAELNVQTSTMQGLRQELANVRTERDMRTEDAVQALEDATVMDEAIARLRAEYDKCMADLTKSTAEKAQLICERNLWHVRAEHETSEADAHRREASRERVARVIAMEHKERAAAEAWALRAEVAIKEPCVECSSLQHRAALLSQELLNAHQYHHEAAACRQDFDLTHSNHVFGTKRDQHVACSSSELLSCQFETHCEETTHLREELAQSRIRLSSQSALITEMRTELMTVRCELTTSEASLAIAMRRGASDPKKRSAVRRSVSEPHKGWRRCVACSIAQAPRLSATAWSPPLRPVTKAPSLVGAAQSPRGKRQSSVEPTHAFSCLDRTPGPVPCLTSSPDPEADKPLPGRRGSGRRSLEANLRTSNATPPRLPPPRPSSANAATAGNVLGSGEAMPTWKFQVVLQCKVCGNTGLDFMGRPCTCAIHGSVASSPTLSTPRLGESPPPLP